MGTNYKAALIPQRIRETIHGWGKAARRKRRHGHATDDSTTHTETCTVHSIEEDDQLLVESCATGEYTEVELQHMSTTTASPSPVANETSSLPTVFPTPTKYSGGLSRPPYLSQTESTAFGHNIFSYYNFSSRASFKCLCTENQKGNDDFEGFSVLSHDKPWERGSIWSTMGLYFFSLHIPLSFGGLSVVAEIMHQPVLDPQTKATSLLLIQSMELWGALVLLTYTAKPQYKLSGLFEAIEFPKERSWVHASAMGFGFLILLVLVTSFLADKIIGPKVLNNTILKEILSSGSISTMECFLIYCLITPLLEETVYRGFLLRSLTATMKWHHAVIVSSCIFSAAHFSAENSLQLFLIGCILGCSYCWSGSLSSSFVIHSLYNAVTLMVTILT
ncbi:uncharacterized protein LOC122065326 [Macadamia integrifolia]|uniref:uncharacterized protein LOC122065326 n=1 Tax=Macadamia integrifolia TaxID=60698 RepID=UPI001C500689|nr:uncharacterized protein LOC122065326 [Macadamia integrifolia]